MRRISLLFGLAMLGVTVAAFGQPTEPTTQPVPAAPGNAAPSQLPPLPPLPSSSAPTPAPAPTPRETFPGGAPPQAPATPPATPAETPAESPPATPIATATPPEKPAAPLPPHGFSLAVRAGLGFTLGKVVAGGDINQGAVGWGPWVPLTLDVAYRLSRRIRAGIYFQYAPTIPAACVSGASCAGSDIRAGVEGEYHWQPERNFDPWVGLGIGYEYIFEKEASDAAGTDSSSNSGIEFLNLQLGGDVKVGDQMWLGPFALFSIGSFVTNLGGASLALHDWLVFGVRGRYDM